MHRFRLAILGAAAATLLLGGASALAMQEGAGGTDPDSHGDAVASAARNCPHGASGVHGKCVSAIASTEGQENRDGAQSDRVHACQAADKAEDATETKPARGDKAAKAAGRTEDRTEHDTWVACVHAATGSGS